MHHSFKKIINKTIPKNIGGHQLQDFIKKTLMLREAVESIADFAYKSDSDDNTERDMFRSTADFGKELANAILKAWSEPAKKGDSAKFSFVVKGDKIQDVKCEFFGPDDWSNVI
jgi:phage-related tail protein